MISIHIVGYKVAIFLTGAVISAIIDTALGIEYPNWWKSLAHKVTYMVWGGIIVLL